MKRQSFSNFFLPDFYFEVCQQIFVISSCSFEKTLFVQNPEPQQLEIAITINERKMFVIKSKTWLLILCDQKKRTRPMMIITNPDGKGNTYRNTNTNINVITNTARNTNITIDTNGYRYVKKQMEIQMKTDKAINDIFKEKIHIWDELTEIALTDIELAQKQYKIL